MLYTGLLTAIHKDYLRVLNYRELLFNDFGDRVAQLLHVQSVVPSLQNRKGSVRQEFLIVNTHLLFPHDSSLSLVRLHQVYKFPSINKRVPDMMVFVAKLTVLFLILGCHVCLLIGSQNTAICGIISERKQAQTDSHHSMWVSFCLLLFTFSPWHLILHEKALLLLCNLQIWIFSLMYSLFYFL